MKQVISRQVGKLLPPALLLVGAFYFNSILRSVDYYNGMYHPIPRMKYFIISLVTGALGASLILIRRILRNRQKPH